MKDIGRSQPIYLNATSFLRNVDTFGCFVAPTLVPLLLLLFCHDLLSIRLNDLLLQGDTEAGNGFIIFLTSIAVLKPMNTSKSIFML